MTNQSLGSLSVLSSEELMSNPEALRALLDCADIPINYCSAGRTYLFVNKAYAEWYGRTPDQIIGKSLIEILGEKGYNTIRPFCDRALKGEAFRYETGVNLSIGYRYLQCSYTPVFNHTGAVTGWVGIIYDMTQRHLMEKTLQENEAALKTAKQKAESANIAKTEFMANISHEIRTPMNAILGLAQLLDKSEPLTGRQRKFIDTLQLSTQSLLTLINDLLDFCKTESRNIELQSIPFCLSAIIDDVIALFSKELKEKNLSVTVDKGTAEKQVFLGDPIRIKQIVINLFSNAVKFTHKGSISIKIAILHKTEPNRICADITVRDTGIGIPPDKISMVFDKFTQADMSITRNYGGSGLGLAISKNLAELMGGSITVESTLGKGSEFILHLPLEYAKEQEIPPLPSQGEQRDVAVFPKKELNVLIAEDNPTNVLVLTSMLEKMHCHCDIARTGKEALAKICHKRNRYDVILMDVQMPEIDGRLVTAILREKEAKTGQPRTTVIGVTAQVMPDSIEKCFKAGMDDYIAKPFTFEYLQQKIAKMVVA